MGDPIALTHSGATQVLYRYAARTAHPDAGGSTEDMTRVNEAVGTLRSCRGADSKWVAEPRIASIVLDFGKHAGRELRSVPMDYLKWMAENMERDAWRRAAEQMLDWYEG